MKIQRPLWALALLWLVWGVLWPVGAIESLCLVEGLQFVVVLCLVLKLKIERPNHSIWICGFAPPLAQIDQASVLRSFLAV